VTAKAATPEAALALAQFISSQAAAQLGNKNGHFPLVGFAA